MRLAILTFWLLAVAASSYGAPASRTLSWMHQLQMYDPQESHVMVSIAVQAPGELIISATPMVPFTISAPSNGCSKPLVEKHTTTVTVASTLLVCIWPTTEEITLAALLQTNDNVERSETKLIPTSSDWSWTKHPLVLVLVGALAGFLTGYLFPKWLNKNDESKKARDAQRAEWCAWNELIRKNLFPELENHKRNLTKAIEIYKIKQRLDLETFDFEVGAVTRASELAQNVSCWVVSDGSVNVSDQLLTRLKGITEYQVQYLAWHDANTIGEAAIGQLLADTKVLQKSLNQLWR